MEVLKEWKIGAGICTNENNEVLMVLQGKPEEEKKWAVPAGVVKNGETFEQCCVREVFEETGYEVSIIEKVFEKETDISTVSYFLVEITGGKMSIQDPDQLIYDIKWRSVFDMADDEFGFPEDKKMLIDLFSKSLI
mgnify:CR=1 FL=1